MTTRGAESFTEKDLEEISNVLQSLNDPDCGVAPSKSVMNAYAAVAVASAGMDMSRDDNDEYERWLRIKLNLGENLTLKEDNQRLKDKLAKIEKDIKEEVLGEIQALKEDNGKLKKTLKTSEMELEEKDKEILNLEDELNLEKLKISTQQRELNEIKGYIKKLYTAAGSVLVGLGGSVLPFREIDEGEQFALVIEEFCGDIQARFSDWQGNHQLMHNELEKTLKMVEGFAEQCRQTDNTGNCVVKSVTLDSDIDGEYLSDMEAPSGASSKRPFPSSLSQMNLKNDSNLALGLSRHNPLRKCRLPINSYEGNYAAWDHLSENTQFACEPCGDLFCRLAYVHSQLASSQNKSTGQDKPVESEEKTKGRSTKRRKRTGVRSQSGRKKKSRLNTTINNFEEDSEDIRLKLVTVEPSGQEHKFVGIRISEETKDLDLEDNPSTVTQRYFCKCGRNYARSSGLYQHLKCIEKESSIQCDICNQQFQIHNGLKAHMRNVHGENYVQRRFLCLECGQRFTTKKGIESHQKLEHNQGYNDDEDG